MIGVMVFRGCGFLFISPMRVVNLTWQETLWKLILHSGNWEEKLVLSNDLLTEENFVKNQLDDGPGNDTEPPGMIPNLIF